MNPDPEENSDSFGRKDNIVVSSSNIPPDIIYDQSVPLDIYDRPQYVFTIHGNSTRFNFNIENSYAAIERSLEQAHSSKSHRSIPIYKISLIIETMKCFSDHSNLHDGESPPSLVMQWVWRLMNLEFLNNTAEYCTEKILIISIYCVD